MDENFDKVIAKCFDNSDTADRVTEKLLGKNPFTVLVLIFIRHRTRTEPAPWNASPGRLKTSEVAGSG